MVRMGFIKKVVCLGVLFAFMGTFVTPNLLAQSYSYGQDYEGEYGTESQGMGRALGGAVGLAGGAFAASYVLGMSSIAAAIGTGGALAGLPGMLLATCVTAALGLVGAKLGSRLGAWADKALGPSMTWTLFGASIGAMLGVMFLPQMAFAGAFAPILKFMIGGFAGGILCKLFAPWLQTHATPKLIFAGLGGFLGGTVFGIPGAIGGIAAGYVIGGMFDRNLFSDPRRSVTNDLGLDGVISGAGSIGYWIKNRVLDIKDWISNNGRKFQDRVRNDWNNDPYYYQERYRDPQYYGFNQGSDFYKNDQHYGNIEYNTQWNDQAYYPQGQQYGQDIYQRQQNYYDQYDGFMNSMQNGSQYDQQRQFELMMQNNQYYRDGMSR